MITERINTITRAAEAAVEADEITGLRSSIVGALVISALQVWLTDWVADGRNRPVRVIADEVVAHLRSCLTPRTRPPTI
jgi:hypothetical protein